MSFSRQTVRHLNLRIRGVWILFLSLCLIVLTAQTSTVQDPLPSWQDGPAKQAIIGFVKAVTDKSGLAAFLRLTSPLSSFLARPRHAGLLVCSGGGVEGAGTGNPPTSGPFPESYRPSRGHRTPDLAKISPGSQ